MLKSTKIYHAERMKIMEPGLKLSFSLYFTKAFACTALFVLCAFLCTPVAQAQSETQVQPTTQAQPEAPAQPEAAAPAPTTRNPDNELPVFKLPELPAPEEAASNKEGNSAFSLPEDDDLFSIGDDDAGQSFQFEESPEEAEASARREAFDAALQGLLPLRPGEIRELLEHFDRTQESVEVPVHPYPKPVMAVDTVSLDPGTKPLTVMVAHGHVTTINFVDTTGAPWPVENITWAGNFEVVETEAAGEDEIRYSNIIRISPESEFAYGNMSIMMTGLRTPIIMTLETSRDIVHYRFDAIIPENGPFAKIPIISKSGIVGIGNPLVNQGLRLNAGDEDITSVLEGVAPAGSEKLMVSGVDRRTSAYKFNGMTYVRTPHTLLSPGWSSSATSADGMHVYSIEDAPVLILSDNGRMVRARLSDREDVVE